MSCQALILNASTFLLEIIEVTDALAHDVSTSSNAPPRVVRRGDDLYEVFAAESPAEGDRLLLIFRPLALERVPQLDHYQLPRKSKVKT